MPQSLSKTEIFDVARAFARALKLHEQGRLQEAEPLYREILSVRPDHVDALHMMGLIKLDKGQPAEALRFVSCAMQNRKPTPKILFNQGLILKALARSEEAASSFQQAIKLKSKFAEAHNELGIVLASLGREEEAVGAYQKAISAKAGFAEAHYNRGISLLALGRYEEALKAFDRALALNPRYAKAHCNRGVVLASLAKFSEALTSYEAALALDPSVDEARINLGRALIQLKRFDEALVWLEEKLARDPNNAEALYVRGRLFLELNQDVRAAADFERSLALQPDYADAHIGSCFMELPILYDSEAEIGLRRAAYERKLRALLSNIEAGKLKGVAKAISTQQPFYLAYQGFNDRELQTVYGDIISRVVGEQFSTPPLPPAPTIDEPIRVGIVSAHFKLHSNWKIPIKGWLSQLDRNRFRLFGYHLGEGDAETEVAASLCERFVHRPLDVAGWRQEILADAPHVLIYPGILMDAISFQLAAQRLAPVQCTSWGHPETSGLPTLDYFLSSDLMEPPDAAEHYTERLIRLPNLSIYYEPVGIRPAALTREALGVPADSPVFWCGQSLYKYLPQFDDVFPRIVRQAPTSRFVFVRYVGSARVTEAFQARLERAFAAHGIAMSDHCVFLRNMTQDEFSAAMGLCDVFLDSIGWSGCNSTLESLPYDLPIVTIPGALMRGRHSAAILQMMGITETIAKNLDEYVTIAARLANDPTERQVLSGRIAESKERVFRDRTCIAALETFLESAVRG